jgi:hypothetical protein
MTKSRIAEWILSQVLPPDRAASTVGDWMEDVDKRGNIWLWSCVFRTAIAGLWREIADNPVTTARICILEFGRSVLIPIGLSLVVQTVATQPADVAIRILTSLWYVVIVNRALRRFSSRALAGCFAISVVGWTLVFAWLPYVPAMAVHHIQDDIFPYWITCVLVPGLWFRRRQLHPVG